MTAPRAIGVLVFLVAVSMLAHPDGAAATPLERYYELRSATLEPVTEARLAIDGVFGVDERVPVTNTSTLPGAATVHLAAQWPTGEITHCSGFMVGPRTVGTASHCIYQASLGGWAVRVQASPGANGPHLPFGHSWAVTLHSVSGWTDLGDRRFDYGAITLDTEIGHSTGWFGASVDPDDVLLSTPLATAGYSGDKPFATQWRSEGMLDALDQFFLYTRIDVTYGNSGGPVWRRTPAGEHYVVGIVTGGVPSTNVFVRVNHTVFSHLVQWRDAASETPTSPATPEPPPAPATPAGTITVDPGSVQGNAGEAAIAVVRIGASNGHGDLTVTTGGGGLIANAYLTPHSCAGGAGACSGTPAEFSTSVTIPDATNDIGTVLLTLAGTIERTTAVEITAHQSGTTWTTTFSVTLLGDEDQGAPFTTYGVGLTPGDTVEVFVAGLRCGSTTADADGNWVLLVRATDPCAPTPGAALHFRLNGQQTTAVEVWQPGGAPADVASGVQLEVAGHAPLPTGGFEGDLPPAGLAIVVYRGGPLEQLREDAEAAGILVVVMTHDGRFLTYVVGAPSFVNAAVAAALSGVVPTNTIVLVRT